MLLKNIHTHSLYLTFYNVIFDIKLSPENANLAIIEQLEFCSLFNHNEGRLGNFPQQNFPVSCKN